MKTKLNLNITIHPEGVAFVATFSRPDTYGAHLTISANGITSADELRWATDCELLPAVISLAEEHGDQSVICNAAMALDNALDSYLTLISAVNTSATMEDAINKLYDSMVPGTTPLEDRLLRDAVVLTATPEQLDDIELRWAATYTDHANGHLKMKYGYPGAGFTITKYQNDFFNFLRGYHSPADIMVGCNAITREEAIGLPLLVGKDGKIKLPWGMVKRIHEAKQLADITQVEDSIDEFLRKLDAGEINVPPIPPECSVEKIMERIRAMKADAGCKFCKESVEPGLTVCDECCGKAID